MKFVIDLLHDALYSAIVSCAIVFALLGVILWFLNL